MSNKRFYWLKLPEDFFNRNDIKVIESQKNGPAYLIFYLKLLTQSIEFNGDLRFNEAIPFNEDMLSTITGTDIDIVRTAMKLFDNLGLIEIFDDKTIYMVETTKMLGTETASTRRSQKSRAKKALIEQQLLEETLQCNSNATAMQQNATESKSKELEKELDLEKELELLSVDSDNNLDNSSDEVGELQQQHISFEFVSSVWEKMKLKSNLERFYEYYKNMEWKFHNGKPITEKSIQKLAYNWERQEAKFNTNDKTPEFTEDLGLVI